MRELAVGRRTSARGSRRRRRPRRRGRRRSSAWMSATIGPIVSAASGSWSGRPRPRAVGVLEVGGGHLRASCALGTPCSRGGVVDLVVDVRDVGHERHVVALVLEEALEQREDDVRAGVAHVDSAVDRRAAGVDADLAGVARLATAGAPAVERVVRANLAHARARYPHIRTFMVSTDRIGVYPAATCLGRTPQRAGFRWSRSIPDASRAGTWAPIPASTPRTTSSLGDIGHTWEVRADHARRPRAQGADAPGAGRRHRHRRRHLAAVCARASSPASRRSRSASCTRAETSTSRWPSRACSACPTVASRCCACTTSGCGRLRISTLTMGEGRDVLLVHGLGATKASFFDTAAALSRGYRVHAIDLPGFGSSSKPRDGALQRRMVRPAPSSA